MITLLDYYYNLKNINLKKILIIFNFSFFIFNLAFATANAVGTDIFSPQKQTPSGLIINTISKPEKFNTSNDMTRVVGSFYVAVGEPLYIRGTLTDAFGVPISGANIWVWHTNASGRYQNLLRPDSEYIDENFIMSGSARTDNLGRYGFKTIFPGFTGDRAPHINIIISHQKFGEIQTEFYFENHPKNMTDPHFMSYSEEDRKALVARVLNYDFLKPEYGKIAVFNVILDGIHSYKGF